MEFKEFTEYSNPESLDYDIKSGLRNNEKNINEEKEKTENKYSKIFSELYFFLGCPEDFELASFGFTEDEFDNPTKETIEKLKNYAIKYNMLPEEKNSLSK